MPHNSTFIRQAGHLRLALITRVAVIVYFTLCALIPGARATDSPSRPYPTTSQLSPQETPPPITNQNDAMDHKYARTVSATSPVLQQVVVTAEKRAESLQAVPMSLSALTSAQLSNTASFQFQDYVGKVPGLTLIDDGALGSQLVIRGLTSGGTAVNSPVAVYIDETPYTATGPWAGSFLIAPNLDTFDMKRIEVLRGPQGTLYGAQSLGGLVKYVTTPPDPSHFSATVQTGANSVYNGSVGYDVHGMVNLPLISGTALRIVAYDRFYPGFIDDPSRNLTGINGTHFTGARISLLYRPTSALSLRLNGLYQRRSWDDNGNEDVYSGSLAPIRKPLQQERVVSQPGHNTNELFNLTVHYDFGFAQLMSSTSDSEFQTGGVVDYSEEFGPVVSAILGAPYGMVDIYQPHDRAFTQEVRLSSRADDPFTWQIGLFYTDQRGADVETFLPTDLTANTVLYAFATNLGSAVVPVRYREHAGYADLDYHISKTLDLGLGGRYSSNRQRFNEIATGAFFGPTDILTTSSGNDFTYSTDLRWRPSSARMLYARIASGYQPGGPNDTPITAPGASRTYASSTATSYETGLKQTLLTGKLQTDIDVFTVEWRRIQVEAVIGGFNSFTNGGNARSNGVEWQVNYVPMPAIRLGFNGAYTHAYLTAPTPIAVNGRIGDRLPGAPLISGSVTADYTTHFSKSFSAIAGADWRYTGNRYADFTATGFRQQMPSFGILDLHVGLISSRWTVLVYAKNICNKLAVDYVRPETLIPNGPQSAVVYRPRTIGISVTAAM